MQTYSIFSIPDGPAGTADTLDMMRTLTIDAQFDPITRLYALKILNSSMARNAVEFGKAVWRWVRAHVRLIDEPFETLHHVANTPDGNDMLHALDRGEPWINGDCDDMAILAGSLIFALGYPVRYTAVKPAGQADYQHVFAEMMLGGSWYAVDPTVDDIPDGLFDHLTMDV